MSLWITILVTAIYIAGLFFIAWRSDARNAPLTARQSGIIYALALSVYCTSWTFYGAVGTAVTSQWDYLWILLGPAIVFAVMPTLHKQLADIGQREGVSSLSDFLSARYGTSGRVAALAALAAVAGSLPYIALQLKSVSTSLSVLTGASNTIGNADSVLAIAIAMALFAIVFGTRGADVTQRNRGLVIVLAVEALLKLIALIVVALFSVILLSQSGESLTALSQAHFSTFEPSGRSVIIMIIAMTAILCLPRQFYVTVVERDKPSDSHWAQWLLPLYLILTALLVIPITIGGLALLPEGTAYDSFVLSLPLSQDAPILGLLVFLGGISAATGMVIVASLTLSTMVTNDLIVPLLLKRRRGSAIAVTGGRLILIRRVVIVCLLLLAYAYFRAAGAGPALASIGLLSFAAAAQFAPLLLGALFWPRANHVGASLGLAIGMFVWAYTLFLPAILGYPVMQAQLPAWLDPHGLFGIRFDDALTHGVLWSLGLNIAAFILGSVFSRERLRDRVQASAFSPSPQRVAHGSDMPATSIAAGITDDDLRSLASRFLGAQAVNHAFSAFEREAPEGGWARIRQTERLLSRAIGASSARVILSSALSGSQVRLADVLRLFDQRSAKRLFDDHGVQALLESLGEGISVVDNEQRLIAWNGVYIDLFDYPDDLLRVGTPIERLIRHNIDHGWIKTDDPEAIAKRRVASMREGRPHLYERENPDGRFLRIEGHALPGGAYITTFRDITEDRLLERELREVNETLEQRVLERTEDLRSLTADLDQARKDAEAANLSKTRFLAAASHDLLQPLNAARLFLASVDAHADGQGAVTKAERAIQSADELLKGLLDISRLDQSNIAPQVSIFPLGPLMEDLVEEARPMAEAAGLQIDFVPTSLSVETDPVFLQSILRNFLSNARRYTLDGGVLMGARRAGDHIRIEVWDTGPGLSPTQQTQIFEEFKREAESDNRGIRGAGLGLSVVRRLADLMGANIAVKSEVGRGSVFSVSVPRAGTTHVPQPEPKPRSKTVVAFEGITVICLDDDPANLEGLEALLAAWGCQTKTVSTVSNAAELFEDNEHAVLIADYDLGGEQTGLDLIERRIRSSEEASRNILLTAAQDPKVKARCQSLGASFLSKPVDPDQLRAALRDATTFMAQPPETASR